MRAVNWTGVLIGMLTASLAAAAEAPLPSDNAADVYIQANQLVKVDCPASSNIVYPDYPPFSPEWQKMEKDAWDQNGPMRDLARQARSLDTAVWPMGTNPSPLNQMRNLANQLGDAAVYENLQGNNVEAIEEIRDLLHMSDMLQQNLADKGLVRVLVAAGIKALAMNRLEIIASGLVLTANPNDAHNVWTNDARDLIKQLLAQPDPHDLLAETGDQELAALSKTASYPKLVQTLNRCNTEQNLAAMSLACQVYRFEKGHWPDSSADLIPAYLPSIPLDPWGDGKQTLGYVVIKGGLPDGSDRPLVYSRCNSRDGLSYPLSHPEYHYYNGDDAGNSNIQAGEFRDVARWVPPEHPAGGPTMQALP
jgi:hypothetical protein